MRPDKRDGPTRLFIIDKQHNAHSAIELDGKALITIRQWDKLDELARKEHKTAADVVNEAFKKTLDSMMAGADAAEPQK